VTFRPGRSGNPQGARLGSRHRTSVLLDKMMQHDAKDIGKVAIERAKGGDMTAIKILLDRLSPVPRGRFLRFQAPKIENPADLAAFTASVLQALANGELTAAEASDITSVVAVFLQALQTAGLRVDVSELKRLFAEMRAEIQELRSRPSEPAS
jgi:hypothetical protein